MNAVLKQIKLSPDAGLPLATTPLADVDEWAPIVWAVAAHGGAGASSLAHALAPMGDAGQCWPVQDEHPWCVIVARSTRDGLEAAHDALLQAQAGRAGSCVVLGLMVVADAPGKLPKPVLQKLKVIERIVPQIWRVSFHAQWRSELIDHRPDWSPLDESDDDHRKWFHLSHRSGEPTIPADVKKIGEELVELVQQLDK